MTQLEVAYRRLLLAYPRSFRRERGIEVVTTLMDAAHPDQRKPTSREAANLVLSGLMWRFRLPRGFTYRTVAVVAALFFGLAAAAGGSQLAWQNTETMPTNTQALSAIELVTRLASNENLYESAFYDACDKVNTNEACESLIPAGAEPAIRSVYSGFELPQGGVNAAVEKARKDLAAAGWSVGEIAYSNSPQAMPHAPEQTIFWAVKDDLVVRVSGDPTNKYAPSNPSNFMISVHKQLSPLITIATVGGFVIGLIAGLMLAGWALRAFQRFGWAGRVAMLIGGAPALVLALLFEIAAIVLAVFYTGAFGWSHQDSRFAWLVLMFYPPLTVATAVGFVMSLGAALLAPFKSFAETADDPTTA